MCMYVRTCRRISVYSAIVCIDAVVYIHIHVHVIYTYMYIHVYMYMYMSICLNSLPANHQHSARAGAGVP